MYLLGKQPVLIAHAFITASVVTYSGYRYVRTEDPFHVYLIVAPGVSHEIRTIATPRQVGYQEIFGVATRQMVHAWLVLVKLRVTNKTVSNPNRTANFLLLIIHFLSWRHPAELE